MRNAFVPFAVLLSAPFVAAPVSAETIERELLKQAPAVIKHFHERGCQNIGVLKFRIKKGDEPLSDNVGTLNMFLARRLEVALMLANDNDVTKQLGIVKNASAAAAKLPGANHGTLQGREKLFAGSYPLAWGNKQATVDGFVTGLMLIDADLRNVTVGLLAFDKTKNSLEKVASFTAPLDVDALSELGESFVLRGAFDKGSIQVAQAQPQVTPAQNLQTQIVQTAFKVKSQEQPHPLADPESPVVLEVMFDGRPMPLEFKDGQALLTEPQQGQLVSFVLKRRKPDGERLAVVFKVNGENTLGREKQRDFDCRRWVLEPSQPPIVIRGFQTTDQQAAQFVVLSKEESRQNEINYGEDVGLISLTVFREKKTDPNAPPPSDLPPGELPSEAAEDLAAMLRGAFPAEQPKNLSVLKQALRKVSSKTRGIIANGQQIAQASRHTTFITDPIPVMSASIRYYKP